MADAFLRSWPAAPWLWLILLGSSLLYLRGWRRLYARSPWRWSPYQPAAFLGGQAAIFLALGSPIEVFASLQLRIHMLQHLLLMMAAPPLIWLGAPFFPVIAGLPLPWRRYWIGPLVRSSRLRRAFAALTHPRAALVLFTAATWAWHAPAPYELALRSPAWHYVQHACFLAAGLLFWYPVVRPYPSRPAWPLWLLVPYLILADVQNTALSALLTFSERPIYGHYESMPILDGLPPLEDQAAAGVLMWVPGSLAFLGPLLGVGVRLMLGRQGEGPKAAPARRIPLPLARPQEEFDWLSVPVLGRFLRWRHARAAVQVILCLLAAAVIVDGLMGPEVGPMNLAGVLPWIHWRGLLVLGLLFLGNLFCLGCPFLLPRTIARRLLPLSRRPWPRGLRNKWMAVVLLVIFFWAYEAFALWDSPWWTAWIAIGYFVCPLVLDSVYRGAPFCKYVCPIGQFNFVQSLVSPFEVKVREKETCLSCRTKDCIRGAAAIPGCELNLFQPRKASNLDCTFCLDCIHACPHDNIGILAALPARELWRDPHRSGVGRFSRRLDLAALVLILVFGAFANAAEMIEPVVAGREWLAWKLGVSDLAGVSILHAVLMLVTPFFLVAAAAWGTRSLGGSPGVLEIAGRYAYSLVPLGFSMWLAHYCFHLFTSAEAIVPAAERFALDHGWTALGTPDWTASCCRPAADWLLRAEILCLDLGLLLSLYTAYRLAAGAILEALPWMALQFGLFAVGVWILLQPMQMRGTLMLAG